MRRFIWIALLFVTGASYATPKGQKAHVVSLGKPQNVAWFVAGREAPVHLPVRPLYVDGKVKEYTVGPARDITERLFVVRRVFRINDALPGEDKPQWRWERGGWISVDRSTGRVSSLSLPAFDSFYSVAVWYRDYVAYCGTSDDRSKVYAIVFQLGHRKPLFRQWLRGKKVGTEPDSACAAPSWERDPARVIFKLDGGEQLTFSTSDRHSELAAAEESDSTAED